MGRFWLQSGGASGLAATIDEQRSHLYGDRESGVLPDDVVLDCGANVGVYTRVALRAGARKVVAIEVAPVALECLRRNFSAEMAEGRVIVYPKGVWDQEGTLTLFEDPDYSMRDSFVLQGRGKTPGPKVALVPIDNIVKELGLTQVDFIKMDIEGAEQRALLGARETVQRFRPRLAICAYHLEDDPERIPEIVRRIAPEYHVQCRRCEESNTRRRIVPDVLFFSMSRLPKRTS